MNLNQLKNNLKNCSKCSIMCNSRQEIMGKNNYPICWYNQSITVKYMIVGLAPGRKKIDRTLFSFDNEYSFKEGSGKILFKCLDILNIKSCSHITNLIKCTTPKDDKFINDDVTLCINSFLKNEIEIIQPKKIIVLGNKTKEIFENQCNYKFHYIYHPSYILRGFMKFDDYISTFKEIL